MSKQKEKGVDADKPRISFKSLLYCYKIYKKAVGKKRYIFSIHRVYSAIMPSVTAIISGVAVTQISEAASTHDLKPLISTVLILFGIQIISILFDRIVHLLSSVVAQEICIEVSSMVMRKYISIPLSVRESKEFADKFSRVKDFGDLMAYTIKSILTLAGVLISLLSVIVATITISPLTALIVVLAAIPDSIISVKLSRKMRKNWRIFTVDRRKAWMIEEKVLNSNSALEIELNGLSDSLIDNMIHSRRKSQDQDLRDEREFFWPRIFGRVVDTTASYGVLLYVANQIIKGKMPIGQFLTIKNLFSQLGDNIVSLFSNVSAINENLVNATDYMEFMDTPNRANGEIKITKTPKIEFRNVSFKYPNSNEYAIKNVSFTLNPSDSVAIVGENGAGKTTLIKLLVGAYVASSGEIFINDRPISEIERNSYLDQIGALFQDYSRYDFATLGENVWFGDVTQSYDEKKILAALKKADLGGLVNKLDNGLSQILSKDLNEDNAADLSGGQWQRVGIARTFFRRPNILIMDEPTSAVDAKAEYNIFKNIISEQEGKTTIIISHRFSTVRKAQRILVLDHGKVVESGTHDELISKDGLYKEMFNLQAEGYM